jgi:hypothetical protein
MANSLILGYTKQDESRGALGELFRSSTSRRPQMLIRRSGRSLHAQQRAALQHAPAPDSFTKFGKNTRRSAARSRNTTENVFFPGKQSAYVCNTLADFYTDANDFLANPNRTTSPVTLRRFQVRYMNIPTSALAARRVAFELTCRMSSARSNLTLTAGASRHRRLG